MSGPTVTLVEVGPRDGFQAIGPVIPTATKIAILQQLHRAGVRRVEATAFVSPDAVPQLADATEVLEATRTLPGIDAQVLVPTARHATRALDAGARHLAFVLSVSARHNLGNVRRTPLESVQEFARISALLNADTRIRINVATAFDCPHDGPVPMMATLQLLDLLVDIAPHTEIALCDTTGRAAPSHVEALFEAARDRFPQVAGWALHAHDTYGLGAANALAAWNAGVRIFDASIAGLGGCPFAPGATGNVATEDLVWMFESMSVSTGIDLDALLATTHAIRALPGAQTGGRVRDALLARRCST